MFKILLFLSCIAGICAPCLSQHKEQSDLEKRIETSGNDSVRIAILLKAAWDIKYSDPQKAQRFTDRAIALSKKRKDAKQIGDSYYYKAMLYYLTAKYDSTLIWNDSAKVYYSGINNHYGLASLFNLRGLVDEKIGDYEQAIKDYHESLANAESTDNLYAQSNPLHNIGLIYNKMSEYKNALGYFLKALTIREQINDSILIAQSYQTIGITYSHLGDTTRSITWQEKAVDFFEKKGDLYDLAMVYSNLGIIYTFLDDYNRSETLLNKALEYNRSIDNQEGSTKVLINLAELDNRRKRFAAAERFALRALHLADSLGLRPELKFAYETLIVAQEGQHKFKDGFYTQYKLRAINDTLLNEEKVRNLTAMETRFQVREKEKHIDLQQAQILQQQTALKYNYIFNFALLLLLLLSIVFFLLIRSQHKRKQEALKQQHELSIRETYINATLESQENERKRVAIDLHDGMGQLISALRLTVSGIHDKMETEERLGIVSRAETVLNDMHREIRSIAFNLMPHTLIQYGLIPALKEMAMRINSVATTHVTITDFGLTERLTEVQEISLYRIIQEWTTNILKYASSSKVEIQFVRHDNEITVTVEDDGKGFDTKMLEQGKGHGWRNIQSRVNRIRGTISLDSRTGRNGTTLVVSVPHNQEITVNQEHSSTGR